MPGSETELEGEPGSTPEAENSEEVEREVSEIREVLEKVKSDARKTMQAQGLGVQGPKIEEYDLEISQEGIDAIKKELGVEEEPIRTDKHTKLRGHNTQQEIFATGDSHLIFSVYREQDSDKIYAQRFSYNPKSTVPRRQ